jgi:hypothetical protein
MCNSISLEDVVTEVVQHFIDQSMLFTALDVSNEVKNTMPTARHRDVRDCVRNIFQGEIEPQNYMRTPIKVTLADGTQADALLYHPCSDSWDLDNKYGAQQRAQVSLKSAVVNGAPMLNGTPAAVSATPAPAPTVAANPTPAAPTVPPFATAKTMWDNLFQTQPSLFPVK